MTNSEQTVPVELLKELATSYRGSSRAFDGDPSDVETTLEGTAYERVIALIPSPPKIGDELTADQIKELPVNAVLRDADDDVWLTADGGVVLAVVSGGHLSSDAAAPIDEYMHYSPFVLVSLPTPRD